MSQNNRRGGRVERWSAKQPAGTGPQGDRLVQVSLEDGVVSSVEVQAPLVEGSNLAQTLEAL